MFVKYKYVCRFSSPFFRPFRNAEKSRLVYRRRIPGYRLPVYIIILYRRRMSDSSPALYRARVPYGY